MSNTNQTWVQPGTGYVYRLVGTNGSLIPTFYTNDSGNLVYCFDDSFKNPYDFSISKEHNLTSDVPGELKINRDGTLSIQISDTDQPLWLSWERITDPAFNSEQQRNVELLLARNKHIRLTVTLLDENYSKVDSLSGKVRSASYDIDSGSDIRRTCSTTLTIPKKDQINLDFERTWNKRMVELSCGILDRTVNQYVWYPLGRMLMVSGTSVFSATEQEVKLSLVDLMASMTESRGSQIGTTLLIPAGSNVKNVLGAIVSTFSPFKRYNIEEFEDTIPYDLTIDVGKYPYNALKTVLDLFPYYEMFYDINGIFTVRKIPMKISDPIEISNTVIDPLLISENRSINFSDVKNTTEIWGRSLDAQYIATACASNGNCYNLTIGDTFTKLVVNETYCLIPDKSSISGQMLKIQDTDAGQIYTQAGDGTLSAISPGSMSQGVPYVIRYTDGGFVLEGELEIHVIVQEIDQIPNASTMNSFKNENGCRDVKWVVNPSSPFACTVNSIGAIDREIRQVLTGGEYGNIYTTQLAYERASYENWLKTRLQDTVEVEMILIPWMDVNDKIQYTSPVSEEVGTFLVQAISYDFARWTMSVKCSRFYPYYPWE